MAGPPVPPPAAHVAVVPSDVRTRPAEPIPKRVALLAPSPTIKSPVVVMGDKALNAAVAVVAPVPPLGMSKVPPRVIVPLDVIGPPVAVRPVEPPDTLTDVTEPRLCAADGESCKSSSDVGLLPPPVRANKLLKNRYHSREINPVRGSIISTRELGMFVMLSWLGIGRAQN